MSNPSYSEGIEALKVRVDGEDAILHITDRSVMFERGGRVSGFEKNAIRMVKPDGDVMIIAYSVGSEVKSVQVEPMTAVATLLMPQTPSWLVVGSFTAETLGLSYLDGLNWAAGLARHAEDAVGFPDWVRFVRSVPVPLFATLLNRLVLACSHLSGIESPFEEGNRTHIQTNTISYAGIPIDRDLCAVYSIRYWVWSDAIAAYPVLAFRPHFVTVVLPRDRILIRLLKKIGVYRPCLVVNLSRHLSNLPLDPSVEI